MKKDSSEMGADLLRPSRLSGSLWEVDAYSARISPLKPLSGFFGSAPRPGVNK